MPALFPVQSPAGMLKFKELVDDFFAAVTLDVLLNRESIAARAIDGMRFVRKGEDSFE